MQVPSIGQFLDPAGYVAFSSFLVLILKRKMGGALKILSWCALVLISIARVESFFLSQVMMLGLCGFAALVYARAYWIALAFASILILSMPVYLFTSTARYSPGAFLAPLDRLLNAPGRRDLEVGVSLGILIPLTYQESNFSVMVGTLPQFALRLYVYFIVGEIVLRRLGMGPAPADQG